MNHIQNVTHTVVGACRSVRWGHGQGKEPLSSGGHRTKHSTYIYIFMLLPKVKITIIIIIIIRTTKYNMLNQNYTHKWKKGMCVASRFEVKSIINNK
jgi:hypothetical protein